MSASSSLSFVLPEKMPQLYAATTKTAIESSVKAILTNTYSSNDSVIFVQFMEAILTDTKWISENAGVVKQVMKACTLLYVNTDNPEIVKKIQNVVKQKSSLLVSYSHNDISITCKNDLSSTSSVACSSLFLACKSEFFDRMFRSSFKEAQILKDSQVRDQRAEIEVEVNSNIFKVFVETVITPTNSTHKTALPPDTEQKLLQYVDMTDSLPALIESREDMIFRHLTQDLLTKVHSHYTHQKAPNIEERYITNLHPENALLLYDLAKANNYKQLTIKALELIILNGSLQQIYDGAVTEIIQINDKSFSGEDVRRACLTWFFNKLCEVLPKLDVRDTDSSRGPIDTLKKSLKSLRLSLNSKTSLASSPDNLFIDKFLSAVSYCRIVDSPALQKLSEQQLEWVLKKLPVFLNELHLSGCKLSNCAQLNRFSYLKALDLSKNESLHSISDIQGLSALESLNLSDCSNLLDISVPSLPNLAFLDISGCDQVKTVTISSANLKLTDVKISPAQGPLLKSLGFN